MADSWTLSELVAEAASWIATLPPPKNGQVRAVPDERTVRYYATLGLLDRPAAMRGRTALYGRRHLAQVVAIKRMQSAGHSLADIQTMWPTLDDVTLARMTGVTIPAKERAARREFWKSEDRVAASDVRVAAADVRVAAPDVRVSAEQEPSVVRSSNAESSVARSIPAPAAPVARHPDAGMSEAQLSLSIEIAPNVHLSIGVPPDRDLALTSADVRALRAAAATLVTELANRGLTTRTAGTLEEEP